MSTTLQTLFTILAKPKRGKGKTPNQKKQKFVRYYNEAHYVYWNSIILRKGRVQTVSPVTAQGRKDVHLHKAVEKNINYPFAV